MMRKRSIIATFIFPAIIIFSVVILLVNNQKELPGELVLEQEKINFGEVPEWKGLVTKSISARNIGKSKLMIERIDAGCSYAKIEGPKALQHGEEGKLKVVFNPETVNSDAPSATAIILTDSPKTPRVYLTIDANIKRFAKLSADICDFGEITPNSIHEKQVRLCVNAAMKIDQIRLMPPSTPDLKWEMEPVEPESSSKCFLIRVKLGPVKTKGFFSSVLTVALSNDRTMTLPVAAKVVSPVKAHPESLFYGTVKQGDKPIAEFILEAQTPFKILTIQAPDTLTIVSQPDNNSQMRSTMKVQWHTKNSPPVLREKVKITTSADQEPIQIPIYGLIQRTN